MGELVAQPAALGQLFASTPANGEVAFTVGAGELLATSVDDDAKVLGGASFFFDAPAEERPLSTPAEDLDCSRRGIRAGREPRDGADDGVRGL